MQRSGRDFSILGGATGRAGWGEVPVTQYHLSAADQARALGDGDDGGGHLLPLCIFNAIACRDSRKAAMIAMSQRLAEGHSWIKPMDIAGA